MRGVTSHPLYPPLEQLTRNELSVTVSHNDRWDVAAARWRRCLSRAEQETFFLVWCYVVSSWHCGVCSVDCDIKRTNSVSVKLHLRHKKTDRQKQRKRRILYFCLLDSAWHLLSLFLKNIKKHFGSLLWLVYLSTSLAQGIMNEVHGYMSMNQSMNQSIN